MKGILNILKPPGMTSFDVVGRIRKLLDIRKVGHTGTLDPDAVGILPICVGRATRIIEYMMDDHKFYRARITLGAETDTQDSKGKIIAENPVNNVDSDRIEEVLSQFRGKIEQIPPMVSAVKHNGKRLYELARKGIEVEREAREVEIYSLKLLDVDLPHFWVDVESSKGTYIRTLGVDIGRELGCGAHLSYLIRTRTGDFDLENSVTLAEIEQAVNEDRVSDILLPVDWAVRSFPKIIAKGRGIKKAKHGNKLQSNDYQKLSDQIQEGDLLRVYAEDKFISISKLDDLEEGIIKPVKVFA